MTLILLACSFGGALGYAYWHDFAKVAQKIERMPAAQHIRPRSIDTVAGLMSAGIIVLWALGVIA